MSSFAVGAQIMKIALFAVAATLALGVGAAVAADPVYPVIPEGEIAYDWTGAYAGVHVGGAKGTYSYVFPPNVGRDLSGLVIGGQAGYNWQYSNYVFGLEGSASYSGVSGTSVCPAAGFSCDAGVNWLATIEARAGIALDTFLPYLTGGLAVGGLERTSSNGVNTLTQNQTSFGWTIGGGVEFALNDQWTLGAEYAYVRLNERVFSDGSVGGTSFSRVDIGANLHTAKLNLNYRF